ncbi:hypothetical protein ABPG75_000553 [Micractinium tetrahymenae]
MEFFDSATTGFMLEAVQAGDAQRLRALAAVNGGATPVQLTACLAGLLFTAAPGSTAMLRCLLAMGASPTAQLGGAPLDTVQRLVSSSRTTSQLLCRPPIVIAACRLQPEAVELLMQHGAVVPRTVGESAGMLPLLAYWSQYLPAGGEHPAALATLGLLLRGGADPLAIDITPQYPDLTVRGRAGTFAGFFLTCRSPPLLGAAVRHVLEQCREGGRVLAPQQVAQMCMAAHLAGPALQDEAEQLLAQAVLAGNCFPGASRALVRVAAGSTQRAAGKAPRVAPELAESYRQRRASAGPALQAGPSSRHGSPRAGALGLPPLGLGSAHRHRQDWLLSLHLRRQQAAAACQEGAGEEGQAEAEEDTVAVRHTEWQRTLRAQLVADAAMHGAADLLAVLLGQGASPSQAVPWLYPPEALPPRGIAYDIPTSLPSRSGDRSPLALAAAGGQRDAMAVLLRHGAQADAAVLRHAVWSLNPAGVEALLSLWPGALPPSAPSSYAEGALNCPILLLLQRHLEASAVAAVRAAAELRCLEASAVAIMDLLVGAGVRINVYRDMCGRGPDGVWRMGRFVGLQHAELDRLKVEGRNRLLWEAYTRPAWSKAAHRQFRPSYKAAVREFLLVSRFGEDKHWKQLQAGAAAAEEGQAAGPSRRSSAGGSRRCSAAGGSPGRAGSSEVALAVLGQLPEELLLQIIAAAAYPLSSWVRAA